MAKEGEDAKKKQGMAEKLLADEKEKAKRIAEAEKRALDRVKTLEKTVSEMEALRRDKIRLEGLTKDLKAGLAEQTQRAVDAEGKVQTEALEAENRSAPLAIR